MYNDNDMEKELYEISPQDYVYKWESWVYSDYDMEKELYEISPQDYVYKW